MKGVVYGRGSGEKPMDLLPRAQVETAEAG